MKFFRRKKKSTPPVDSFPEASSSDADQDFYSRRSEDPPLSGLVEESRGGLSRRTSRHNSAGRVNRDNRTSDWALGLLVLRAVLIVVLLAGGYLLLRFVLSKAAEPTEEEQLQWEMNAAKMDEAEPVAIEAEAASDERLVVSETEMTGLLNEWERTGRHLRAAESLLNKNLDEEAARRLDQALMVSPDNRIALEQRMEIYLREENVEAALSLCLKLLEQDSTQFSLKVTLLETLQQHGEPSATAALADHLLEQQPNNLQILKIAAFSRIEQDQIDEALTIYKRILERAPKDSDALAGAALIHRAQQDWALAIPYYQELLSVKPSAEVYGELARCYAQLDEAGKAVIFLGQAASLYGENTVADWFTSPEFDAVRETVDFRAFADRVVGVETRKAIEAIREHEEDDTRPVIDLPTGGLGLPGKPDLQILKPGN